jgi:hypothetical protein
VGTANLSRPQVLPAYLLFTRQPGKRPSLWTFWGNDLRPDTEDQNRRDATQSPGNREGFRCVAEPDVALR